MSDKTVVHIGENSPEQVAFKLLQIMANIEGLTLYPSENCASKEWVLKNYSACLRAVQNPGNTEYSIDALT